VSIAPATERKNGKQTRPEHVNCKSAAKAIVVDGIEKGQTVRVCADPKCTTHFPSEPQTRARQREAVRAQVRQRNEAEQRLFALRSRVLSEVLKKVSIPFNHSALQLVAHLTVKGIPYEHTIRLAKRRKLVIGREAPSRVELEKKFVSFVKESEDAELARLIVEAGLIDSVSYAREIEKGEPLQLAAHVYGVDIATFRDGAAKEKKSKSSKPEKRKSVAASSPTIGFLR
jgi:ParB family transcriptional regulator, chromosome partitioning protein